jgi:hypothetical protein
MLRIQLPANGVGSGITTGAPVVTTAPEWHLANVAERIRICADHQRSLVAMFSGIRQGAPTESPARPSESTRETAMSVATLSAPPDAHRAAPSDPTQCLDPRSTDWIALDSVELMHVSTQIDGNTDTAATEQPSTSFDDLVTAVSTSRRARKLLGPLPPARRFMVRVAPVSKPHRSTKRNYDYFEELNASLKKLADSDFGTD